MVKERKLGCKHLKHALLVIVVKIQKGEPIGAARPRYRIIFNRRSFFSDFTGYVTSWKRIYSLSPWQTSSNSDHATSFKFETYIKVNFGFTFPFPPSSLLKIINCFACGSRRAFICSNHNFILKRKKNSQKE